MCKQVLEPDTTSYKAQLSKKEKVSLMRSKSNHVSNN